jgi:hypothetical protein
MLRGVIADMLLQDLRLVASLRPPTFTWSVLRAALPAANLLAKGRMNRPRLEDALRKVFVRYRHRVRHPERRVALPFVDALPLARDIDTIEEAEELGGELGGNAAS